MADNTIPAEFVDLIKPPTIVSIATVQPSGQPQVTAVWIDYDGEYVLLNTAEGRQKDRNLQRNPRVTVLSIDPKNTQRTLEVRGTVVERTTEGALDHINKLAREYRGKPEYFGHVAAESLRHTMVRVIYKIKPDKVVTRKG